MGGEGYLGKIVYLCVGFLLTPNVRLLWAGFYHNFGAFGENYVPFL